MTDLQDLNDSVLDKFGRAHGNKSVVELIDLFLVYVPKNINAAVAAEKTGDLIAVGRAVHAVKSSSGNIGADTLRELAGQIEHLSSEGNENSITPLMRQLEAAFSRLKSRLEMKRKGIEE